MHLIEKHKRNMILEPPTQSLAVSRDVCSRTRCRSCRLSIGSAGASLSLTHPAPPLCSAAQLSLRRRGRGCQWILILPLQGPVATPPA